jgi:hypothetical protein
MESKVDRLDASEVQHQQVLLGELGASMSDVLSTENVIWVEGATEELCFPRILAGLAVNGRERSSRLLGTTILGLISTGDFESKNKSDITRVAKIYRKLSTGPSILPPALVFILDVEFRTDEQRRDLEKVMDSPVIWLGRTMYENYLVSPGAIAHLISNFDVDEDLKVSPELVEEQVEQILCDPSLYYKQQVPSGSAERIKRVHGTKLLDQLFQNLKLTGLGYQYSSDKVEYGVALTDWLIENEPEELREVFDLLVGVLSARDEETSLIALAGNGGTTST